MKILIAEDDNTSRQMLASIIEKSGNEPVQAVDGEDAWHILQQPESPRLLILDWMMPRLDGLQLCRKLRNQATSDPPYIILLTVRDQSEDIVIGLDSGANDYIAKPFDQRELMARLRVGKRVLELQQELNVAREILSQERERIEETVLQMRTNTEFRDESLRYLQLPVERTTGDLLLSAFRPDGSQHLLLGDFTGHGLTAAFGGPLAADIFYSMTSKDLSIEEIIAEINRRLCAKMPTGLFFAALILELDPSRRRLKSWNFAMPDGLLFRDAILHRRLPSSSPPLGIIDSDLPAPECHEVRRGDRLYGYSDGLIEIRNEVGEFYGQARLEQALAVRPGDLEDLQASIRAYRQQAPQSDDITLLELNC